MDRLFKSIHTIYELRYRADDDYTDRLSRQCTVLLLISFAFLVSSKQFVGRPIACWCPAQFTPSHREYTDMVCWVSNTYYLPMEDPVPRGKMSDNNLKAMISYYQWVPLMLLFQGVLAFIPSQIWRFFNRRSGIRLSTVMDAAHVCSQASYLEIRDKAVRYVVNQMDRYLLAQRDYRTGCCIRLKHFIAKCCCLVGGRLYGNYLTTAYLIVKLIYVANALGQLFVLDSFLGIDFHWYGVYVVQKLIEGQDWSVSPRFPRVTSCEFEIRHQSAKIHSYVVQCVLTINLFNEKIFLFLWFWYIFLAFISIFSLLKWLFRSLYWPGQVEYVRKQLRAFDTANREAGVLAKFTENYMRRDGMFIIRLVGMNMGEVVAGECLCGLWNNYSPERRLIAEKPGRRTPGKARQNGGQRLEVV